MRLLKALLSIACASAVSGPACASQTTTGYIYGFQHLSNGVVFFQTDGSRSAAPACQNANYPKRWVFDATTSAGQAMLATVLTNYGLHRPVEVYGTGACTVSGDNETIAAINTDRV